MLPYHRVSVSVTRPYFLISPLRPLTRGLPLYHIAAMDLSTDATERVRMSLI